MSKILLIGGNGYIGSRLQQSLDVDVVDTNWFSDEGSGEDFKDLTSKHYDDYDTVIL